jgi:hypothetical protein
MNRQEPTQLMLFSNEWPRWKSLPHRVQEAILDGLSQMLLQRLQQQAVSHRITTETSTSTENQDVS